MSQPLEELCVLLIPMREGRVLLPRACVAEVAACGEVEPTPQAPLWLEGFMAWKGRRLPLVVFEAAADLPLPDGEGSRRVVVLHGLGQGLEPPYLGLLTQGFPQLLRIRPEQLTTDVGAGPATGPVLSRVRLNGEPALIPDLRALARMLLEFAAPALRAAATASAEIPPQHL